MRIMVVGTGYVGLVTGTCLADMGHTVVCHDVDAQKVARLCEGGIPIYEPGLAELVHQNGAAGRLHFTTDFGAALAGAEVCFIAVGTPPGADGAADTRQVLTVADAIAAHAQGPLVVAVKSTVPVGTCDSVRRRLQEGLRGRHKSFEVAVVSNPEFLKEGVAVEDFMRPDRIVIGCDDEAAAQTMRRVYASFIRNGHPYLVMDLRSSEMTKYAANAMLAARVSLMNELANLCEPLGADIMAVRQGVGTDRRLGMAFLYAGLGYGGSCFPKDVQALIHMGRDNHVPLDMLAAVEAVNERQKLRAVDLLLREVGDVRGQRVAVWGLAFKPKTDDIRQAPAITVMGRLLELRAEVVAYDPEATANAKRLLPERPGLRYANDPYSPLEEADALVLCTEWGVFRNPDFARMRALMRVPRIIDGRNQYDPDEMRRLGFQYTGIGRPRP